MEHRVSATELARKVGDVLARMISLLDRPPATVREVLTAWTETGEPDPDFADDLEKVTAADRP